MTSRHPITLLITNSIDYVADLLVEKLGSDKVFRYNTDLWNDYELLVSGSTIEIGNPAGRRIADSDIVKVFRRSLMRASTLFPQRQFTDLERYAEEEVWVVWSDLLNIFWNQGKVVLSQPLSTLRSGKLQQLRVATRHFEIPPYRFLLRQPLHLREGRQSVAKSFTFKYANGIGFYSKKVEEEKLDANQPWFLSDYVEASHDVTVAVVRDELFAFELDRTPFIHKTIDWRQAPVEYAHREWQKVELPGSLQRTIFAFMAEMGLHFARIDFLRQDTRYTFLEANYNGEWGWLDPQASEGLMSKILHEIDPLTECVSCPRPKWH